MRIKKFIAANFQEGKAKILNELGEDAVILSSRTINNPEGDDLIEIVAAMDDKTSFTRKKRLQLPAEDKFVEEDITSGFHDRESNSEYFNTTSHIFSEIDSLKGLITDIAENVKYRYAGALGSVLGNIYKILRKNDFSEEYSLKITGNLSARGLFHDIELALKETKNLIIKTINIAPPVDLKTRKVFLFVGPTGSGKTTTLVKLGIVNKLLYKSNVLLVSADSYKVGGAEQLQTYANIATIPFRLVYSPQELSDLITEEKDRNLILIDTTGRSQKNKDYLLELNDYIKAANPDFTYLVHSCTSSYSNIKNNLDEFAFLKPSSIILTKLDEVNALGSIIEALSKEVLPISYFTNGQQIPEDIEPATQELLNKIVLPDIVISEK